MTKRFRLTGFARFLFVMVILVPAAYIGASYYNGENGIANIKKLVGIESSESGSNSRTKSNDSQPANNNTEISMLKQRIEDLEQENRDLKVQIRDLKNELKAVQTRTSQPKKGFQ